jgi:hypothetical protein
VQQLLDAWGKQALSFSDLLSMARTLGYTKATLRAALAHPPPGTVIVKRAHRYRVNPGIPFEQRRAEALRVYNLEKAQALAKYQAAIRG